MTERQDEGARLEAGSSSPSAERPTDGETDERMKRAVDAARREAEERATAEILALEQDLERERERAAKSLEEVQRKLAEAEARAAGNVSVTDAHPPERRLDEERLEREAGEQLDAEMRRLQAESDAKIEAALAKVESDTRARMQSEADRRLAELEEQLRAEAEHAAAQAKDVETARLDAEAEARTAAAEWVRGQTRALQAEAERGAKEQIAELAAELEEAGRALKAAEHQLRDAENRAESAESKLGEASDEDRKRAEPVKSEVAEPIAAAPEAPDTEPKTPGIGPDQAKDDTAEQDSVEATEPKLGFLQRRAEARRARRAEKAAERGRREAEKKKAAEKKLAREQEPETKKEAGPEAAQERREAAGENKPQATAKSSAAKTASRAKSSSGSKSTKAKSAKTRRRGGPLDVNKATFEEFREVGMSVTQATRAIAYRERRDGFDSVDDLDTVPGMSKKLMTEIRDQLTV